MLKRWLSACAAAAILSTVLPGCGTDDPALVPVTGRVTIDDQPVAELIVTLTPVGATAGNGGLGATDEQGSFVLTDVRGGAGLRAGEYKISVYPVPLKSAGDLPTDVVSSGTAGIPAIFTNPNHTPLSVTVGQGGASIEVKLTKTGRDASAVATDLGKKS